MTKRDKEKIKQVDRKVLSFFLMLFPTLLVAMSTNLFVQTGLVVLQAIIFKSFLDRYYEIM